MQVGNYNIEQDSLILHAISGSRAYGLDTLQSDTDYKGIFIIPKKKFYGLETIEQVSNETNDIVFYELKRFFELLLKNNPNIIELLATPADCIIYKHPLLELIRPDQFLSKLCRQTFVLYAESQVKKAKGLNKKIVNPINKERKTIENFCFVAKGQGSLPLSAWLANSGFRQKDCGLVALPHMRDTFAVFHNSQAAGLSFRGIYSGIDANDVLLSSIPAGLEPLAVMGFNKDGYSTYCREYKEYWDWMDKRNETRYQN
ncbi:MAG TPA: nucleotidyltransferase domain-containing protein, partial [Bacteroidia bacterium]|nr:nucleotidyltransferase domain-containing protein [Bacteroidia bacterium]